MGLIPIKNRYVKFDVMVEVPYDKTAQGGLTFYLRWVPVMRRTETAPEEGGHFETVYIQGHYFDDDLPDLETEAFTRAEEKVREEGLIFHDANGVPRIVTGR